MICLLAIAVGVATVIAHRIICYEVKEGFMVSFGVRKQVMIHLTYTGQNLGHRKT